MGDIVFALISMGIYAVLFVGAGAWMFVVHRVVVLLFASLFMVWLFLLVGSVSFWLQRGSKVRDLFQSFYLVVGSYPPDIYQRDKLLFILISVIGLYPGVFLPYLMLVDGTSALDRILLIGSSTLMFLIGILVFQWGLKRYSSGNLVLQM
jgi:ABC-type uncharacterized transport system permease subunit